MSAHLAPCPLSHNLMSGYEGQKEDEVDEKVVDDAPNEGEELTERVSEEDLGA